MKIYGCYKLIVCYMLSIAGCWVVELWAKLDMYVYNVGQANCILVTAHGVRDGKSAIFFDTGAQSNTKFEGVKDHIRTVALSGVKNIWFVLTHTDEDHVNVFDKIAKICQNNIRGVIVGSTDVFNPDEIMIALDLMQILKQYDNNVVIPQNPQQNIAGIEGLLLAMKNALKKTEEVFPLYLEKPWEDALKNLEKQLNVLGIAETVKKYSNDVSIVNGAKHYAYNDTGWKLDGEHSVFNQITTVMRNAFTDKGVENTFNLAPRCIVGVDFLHPNDDYDVGTDANDASIVTKLTCHDINDISKSILLTGDAPGRLYGSIIRNTANNGKLQNIDVLVCPHHGSITKGSHLWYGELKKYSNNMLSIISSDPNGQHKLPVKWWPDEDVWGVHDIVYYDRQDNGTRTATTKCPIFVTGAAKVGYHVNIADHGTLAISEIP